MSRGTGVLRVATLNIWNRSGPWSLRLSLIRHEIERLRPDVIGLQEVFADVDRHCRWETAALGPPGTGVPNGMLESCQASEIARGLGYTVAYLPVSDQGVAKGGGVTRRLQGNAVLSRFPIRSFQAHDLPTPPGAEPRSVLHADIETPWGELGFFVTHLSWGPGRAPDRTQQADVVADCVETFYDTARPMLPAIVVGDFNAQPHDDPIRRLINGSVSFVDAWEAGGDGTPGATYDPRNAFVADLDGPARRIDYIFVCRQHPQCMPDTITTRICFAEPSMAQHMDLWPSDHFGVMSDMTFTPLACPG